MKKSLLSASILTLFFMLMTSCTNKLKTENLTITRADGSTITVETELAITNEEKNFGFMEREKIPDGTGMIFVYQTDFVMSFWMKNTPHPLSIAYIDSNGVIREIYDMKPYSLEPIFSHVHCRYALEVPQGWYKKNNIKPGDKLDVSMFKNLIVEKDN